MTDELLIDLAARSLGGRVLEASDEFFGPKERLILDEPALGEQGRVSPHGAWVDGWQTRRRRAPGHDWAIVRLGVAGVLESVVVDTSHITGAQPASCSIEAAAMPGDPNIVDLVRSRDRWRELLPRSPVPPDSRTRFPVAASGPITHVRLVMYPDGGIARLRCLGDPVPPPGLLDGEHAVDLAAIASGGRVVACSDQHYSSPNRMLAAGDPDGRGDGWLTRRRRDPGDDWAIVRLAGAGALQRLVVDTSGFVGNAPAACTVEATAAPWGGDIGAGSWVRLVDRTDLEPGRRHEFDDLPDMAGVTHLRLVIHPDGGVARFRAHGVAARPWATIAQPEE